MDIFGFDSAKDLLKLQLENPAAATKLTVKKSLIACAVNLAALAGFFAVASRHLAKEIAKETQDENSDTDE